MFTSWLEVPLCLNTFVIKWVPWSVGILDKIQCWWTRQYVNSWIAGLAEALQARKSNLYLYVSISIKLNEHFGGGVQFNQLVQEVTGWFLPGMVPNRMLSIGLCFGSSSR